MSDIERAVGMDRSAVRQMLLGHYGHPATPEKRERLRTAIETLSGEPVTEAMIWGKPEAPDEPQA